MKKLLSSLSEAEYLSMSKNLSSNLLNYLQKKTVETSSDVLRVGVYSPIQFEPKWFLNFKDTDLLQFAVVSIEADDTLGFFEATLENAKKGFALSLNEDQKAKSVVPDIVLVPGVAFTKEMDRLGRGKGYFDRYLKDYAGVKIGICFEQQILDEIKTNEFDIKMNLIITEKNIYKARNIK